MEVVLGAELASGVELHHHAFGSAGSHVLEQDADLDHPVGLQAGGVELHRLDLEVRHTDLSGELELVLLGQIVHRLDLHHELLLGLHVPVRDPYVELEVHLGAVMELYLADLVVVQVLEAVVPTLGKGRHIQLDEVETVTQVLQRHGVREPSTRCACLVHLGALEVDLIDLGHLCDHSYRIIIASRVP